MGARMVPDRVQDPPAVGRPKEQPLKPFIVPELLRQSDGLPVWLPILPWHGEPSACIPGQCGAAQAHRLRKTVLVRSRESCGSRGTGVIASTARREHAPKFVRTRATIVRDSPAILESKGETASRTMIEAHHKRRQRMHWPRLLLVKS